MYKKKTVEEGLGRAQWPPWRRRPMTASTYHQAIGNRRTTLLQISHILRSLLLTWTPGMMCIYFAPCISRSHHRSSGTISSTAQHFLSKAFVDTATSCRRSKNVVRLSLNLPEDYFTPCEPFGSPLIFMSPQGAVLSHKQKKHRAKQVRYAASLC